MPTNQDIERLAYDLWERDGKPHGKDHHHYYEAERQLSAQPKPKKATAPKTATPKATATKTTTAKSKTPSRKAA